MTKNRFKWEDVYKWGVPAFLEVMNGLDRKNQQLKEENKVLKEENEVLKNTINLYSNATRNDIDYIKELEEDIKQLEKKNEQLKVEKEFWKGDACKYSNYLSILSMDCQIVQEAICDLKNVIDVDTEAFKLVDELDDKFDELNQHRIRCMR